jgi:anaerobic selenocysteine-containing dehydrogenase
VGPATSSALPWKDVPELIRTEMDALYEKRRGAIMGTQFDEAWVRMMEGAGWWAPGYRSADELWKRALESGGWWDPFYDHRDWKRVLKTESGRYEFRTDLLGGATQNLPTAAAPAPAVSAQHGTAGGPLALVLFEPLAIAGGTGAELPFLQGILDPGQEERWETWAEIHPESAAVLGVKDRQWVRVESPSGAILARARLGPRVVPGVVAIPVGLGKRGGGRWAKNAGANPLRLLVPSRDPLSGLPDFGATTVRVSLAAAPGMARPPERS